MRWFLLAPVLISAGCLPNGREFQRSAADDSVQRYFAYMEFEADPEPGEIAQGGLVRLYPRADRKEFWDELTPGRNWEMKELQTTNGKTTLEFRNEGQVWRKVDCKVPAGERQPFLCAEILQSGALSFRFVGTYRVQVSITRKEDRRSESDWRTLNYKVTSPAP